MSCGHKLSSSGDSEPCYIIEQRGFGPDDLLGLHTFVIKRLFSIGRQRHIYILMAEIDKRCGCGIFPRIGELLFAKLFSAFTDIHLVVQEICYIGWLWGYLFGGGDHRSAGYCLQHIVRRPDDLLGVGSFGSYRRYSYGRQQYLYIRVAKLISRIVFRFFSRTGSQHGPELFTGRIDIKHVV